MTLHSRHFRGRRVSPRVVLCLPESGILSSSREYNLGTLFPPFGGIQTMDPKSVLRPKKDRLDPKGVDLYSSS